MNSRIAEVSSVTVLVAELAAAADEDGDRIGQLLHTAENNERRIREAEEVEWDWMGMKNLPEAFQLANILRVERVLRQVRKEMTSLERSIDKLVEEAMRGKENAEKDNTDHLIDIRDTATHPALSTYIERLEDAIRIYSIERAKRRNAIKMLNSCETLKDIASAWQQSQQQKSMLRQWFLTASAIHETLTDH